VLANTLLGGAAIVAGVWLVNQPGAAESAPPSPPTARLLIRPTLSLRFALQ
jgi:hypothetical protein